MSLFTKEEYLQRLQKTKERMESQGIDVLLITDPANMNYLSGYDGWSFYVHQMLIVLAHEEQPIWVGRAQDANGAKITTFLDPIRILPYPEDYVQSSIKHPMDFVADLLKSAGVANRRIGIEKDAYYFTALCAERLQIGLPNAKFVDATLLVNWVRLVKSEQEIECMKKAAVIVENAMRAAVETIDVGVRECDAAAKVSFAQLTGTETFGGDYPAIVPLMPSGRKTSCSHLTWTDERYKMGDTVILELAGCYQRYHSPLARTLTVGPPAEKVRNLAEVVVEGLTTALDSVKPGVTCEYVEAAWRRIIEAHGFHKESRLGYAVGLNYPPDWGEHTASIRPHDHTILVPNMTFHMIAGMWLDEYGMEVSETFRVTETGCEVLANVPRQLFVKGNLFDVG